MDSLELIFHTNLLLTSLLKNKSSQSFCTYW